MIRFQSLSRQKRQAIRDEVLRLYAETDLSYGEIAEENGVQVRTVEYIVRLEFDRIYSSTKATCQTKRIIPARCCMVATCS